MRMVNKNNMLAWAEALESGDYKQGHGALCAVDSDGVARFCCLGVATEVAMANGVALERVDALDVSGYRPTGEVEKAAETAHLPDLAMEWLGSEQINPVIGYSVCGLGTCEDPTCQKITATRANDNMVLSFGQIAAMLRKFYEL